ncbi:MAG TPA: mechanosensitive ion channel domain-containing protein [Candidatus Dormibacteraeota bacterium]|nr:mechanosensitive ion channel domain-containing protein [Candidatus Dormibacteraeota bacterium]
MRPAAATGALSASDVHNLEFVAVGLLVFFGFLVASRFIAQWIGNRLRERHVHGYMVVLGRRAVYVIVIGVGITAAFSFAFQTANVTLVGILLATVVAALGVQDLLQDYVSGYYILVERHIRVGDRIELDGQGGEVVEVKLRVTLVRTESGDLLVVPNSQLFTNPVLVRAKGSPEAHAAEEAAKPSKPQG